MDTYLSGAGLDPDAFDHFKKCLAELWQCRDGRTFCQVTESRAPAPIRVLPRGNWQDESGEVLQPAVPHFLPQIAGEENRRLTRLDLARWLVSPDNPLTARTVMNRLWKQFFGTGISAVVDDLGAQGEWPVQPELLDWLACEFAHPEFLPSASCDSKPPHDWDFKHMVKLMVMSSVYRQSSHLRAELREMDPNNRLVASQMPRRLEAEFVRDNALAIAGLINLEVGGPSARPYQPAGYYMNIQFPDRDYYPDKDDTQYRRGVYTWWQRTFLHPMLANFDAPGREECTAIRNVSNTPQQALTLLNDPTFFEAARAFAAQLLLKGKQNDDQRLNEAYELALARPIKPAEKKSLEQFLAMQREHYAADVGAAKAALHVGLAPAPAMIEAPELAAWTEVCRVVLNLHETITRY